MWWPPALPPSLVDRIDVALGARDLQLVLGRLVLARLQGEHLHLLLERQLLGHLAVLLLLLLLLLLLQAAGARITVQIPLVVRRGFPVGTL